MKPVLDELGISTPEELGLDKPELFIPQPEYWWEKKWYVDFRLALSLSVTNENIFYKWEFLSVILILVLQVR